MSTSFALRYTEKLHRETAPRTPRWSRELLNQRKIQESLAKQKKYKEAGAVTLHGWLRAPRLPSEASPRFSRERYPSIRSAEGSDIWFEEL